MQTPPTPFLFTRKVGRKVYAVAGVTFPDGNCCIASAASFFRDRLNLNDFAHGCNCTWAESVTKQKNFAGYAPDYQHFTL